MDIRLISQTQDHALFQQADRDIHAPFEWLRA